MYRPWREVLVLGESPTIEELYHNYTVLVNDHDPAGGGDPALYHEICQAFKEAELEIAISQKISTERESDTSLPGTQCRGGRGSVTSAMPASVGWCANSRTRRPDMARP